jgi:cytochrome b subunit of formate dehydrogenase
MPENERNYLRFPLVYRIEHLVLLVSFTTLAVTGLVQKYSGVGISQWTIVAWGGSKWCGSSTALLQSS